MTTTIEALAAALELCYDHCRLYYPAVEGNNVGIAVRAALAQARAEQAEPVAWWPVIQGVKQRPVDSKFQADELLAIGAEIIPLFTTPPAAPLAKLEPLSDAEICKIGIEYGKATEVEGFTHNTLWFDGSLVPFARAVEAAHNAKLVNK